MTPATSQEPEFLESLAWSPEGLIPAIVQDVETNEVLMMAWMDRSALLKTLETGQTHFHSRSRRKSWRKGETSGHIQVVDSIFVDCDADVILVRARQLGGACHEGYHNCFFRRVDRDGGLEIVGRRVFDAEAVYGDSATAETQPQPSQAADRSRQNATATPAEGNSPTAIDSPT